jgi:nitrogen regulatory protein P-II 1
VKLLTAVTRPVAFEAIKEALALFGVRVMTVTEANRVSHRNVPTQIYRGMKFTSDLTPSLRIELIVSDDEAPDLMHVIGRILTTSDPDDSMLWCSHVDALIRGPTRT